MSGADSLPDPSQFPRSARPSGASTALHPWHIFPVRLRGPSEPPDPSPSAPASSSSPAPFSHSRSALSRAPRNGMDVRSRSSRRDGNSRSSAARASGSGRWPVRGQQASLGPPGEGSSSMLPGVEFARRRRVHSVGRDTEPSGPSVGLVDGRPSRARPGSTVAHHHHHHHHHHHYHHYHHHYHQPASEHPGRGAARSSLHMDGGAGHDRRAGATSHSGAGSGSMASTSTSRAESQRMPFRLPSWMHRSSSAGTSRQEALEARDRLDERLRAAAVGAPPRSSRSRTSLPGHAHAQPDSSLESEVDDDESSNSDEEAWETSMREWLAAWSPAGGAGDDRFRHDIRSSGRPERPKGISKESIAALSRELYCPKTKKRVRDGGEGVCEQEVCPVCLESFAAGHVLLSLPCNHRFHPDCLTPWLESHGLCPYCRARVPDSPKPPAPGANNSSSSGGDGGHDGDDLVSWMTAIERGITRLRFRVSNC